MWANWTVHGLLWISSFGQWSRSMANEKRFVYFLNSLRLWIQTLICLFVSPFDIYFGWPPDRIFHFNYIEQGLWQESSWNTNHFYRISMNKNRMPIEMSLSIVATWLLHIWQAIKNVFGLLKATAQFVLTLFKNRWFPSINFDAVCRFIRWR